MSFTEQYNQTVAVSNLYKAHIDKNVDWWCLVVAAAY